MNERTVNRLWAAGTAAVSLIGFVVLGMIVGGSPLGWDVHVVLASAVFAVILATGSASLWVVWRKRQDRKAGYPVKDERTKILEGRAAYYTVYISTYMMLALLWYNFLIAKVFDLPAFTTSTHVNQVLIGLMLATVSVFFGLRWYFMRKGEAL